MDTTTVTGRTSLNLRWRVVDIVVASVIGVAAGLVFFAWNQLYAPVSAPLQVVLPGLQSLVYGVWVIGGVVGGLVIRKPGAAILVELLAAIVSTGLGAQGGFLTLESGIVQGLGAELVFLAFLYRSWRLPVAILAGAASGLAMAGNDLILYYAGADAWFALVYTVSAVISGAVIAGAGGWLVVRALARTGVLTRFEAGRESPSP